MRTMDRGLPPTAYQAYIASPAWVAQKERWRSRHPRRRRCAACGGRRYDLHHRTYVRLGRERMGWAFFGGDLVPLCHREHEWLHRLQRRMGWSVEVASNVFVVGAGIVRGVRSLLSPTPLLAACVLGLALLLLR